ncbi:MAG: ribokinase [Tidjanibacter sp.]|nr:ribokinase [Tidjanibacter sp.]
MKNIVVIGSSNTDLVIKSDRIPEPGETVMGGDFMMAAGGKGANQAVAAARLGGDVVFVASVGDDMFGRNSLEAYRKDGIGTDYIAVDKNAPSGVALITVDRKAENCIVVASGANGLLSIETIDRAADKIAAADFLLMQLEIPMNIIEYVAGKATAYGTKIILNPAPAAALSSELLSKLFLITPNRTECQLLTGVEISSVEDAAKAADVLLDKGVQNVVITLGTKGSLVKNRNICVHIPALEVKAVDTTAAGDVFNGALAVALSEGKDLVEAARFATRCSAVSVTRMGAQPSIPTRKEIE